MSRLYRQAASSLRQAAYYTRAAPVYRARAPLIVGIAVGGVIWASPDIRQKWVIHNDAAPQIDHRVNATDKDAVRFDPDTQIAFPLRLDSKPPLTLVGLGVRKVSFLRVKVYSVGFYLEQIPDLAAIPGWQAYSSALLLSPSADSSPSGETLMRSLLDQPIACAIRIVPTRNTDFAHLRDGFTRAIQARQKLARGSKLLTEADEERISQSTQDLKALFPTQSVPKGKALTLLRTASGDLQVEYEGKLLGVVKDKWMSRELMLAYFADKDVISQKLKEDVAAGLETLKR